ncbi:hypothetical protein AJ80_03916 [Polytolypa hystricis UAMH7299]|uniref:Nudix hydrolase domain-containing protein n=1 Tax=Polytolypa hystricis (strain UAMH7299) TaxID=1447883 RepID=A0A2B7YD14_POLH7|nr:hypothetical protein AJ80_03916 [Polytolypa hystricis UAMH7299]
MQLEDWLDDLCVRFIINLPREELESVERICFQVEEAQWFYEDFIRPLDPNLPSLSLRAFALRIFQHCPLMSQWSHYHHSTAFSEFLAYKTRVPVRGAILLNQDMDEVVLVKGWKKGANWSFPRGKINKDEKDLDCAIREVYEETGFDIREAGLVQDEKNMKYIEIPMREQNMRLYVIRGVRKDTNFEPRTRKEISKIEWYKLSDLPTLRKAKYNDNNNSQQQQLANAGNNANKFYMVAPFLVPLKKWIAQQKKLDLAKGVTPIPPMQDTSAREPMAEEESAGPTDNVTPQKDVLKEERIPSDLPEVSFTEDPSSQLKRLLNVNNLSGLPQAPPSTQPQEMKADVPMGSALLALLRNGPSPPASHPPESNPAFPSTVPVVPQPQPGIIPYMGHPGMPTQPQFPVSSITPGLGLGHLPMEQIPRSQPAMNNIPNQGFPYPTSNIPHQHLQFPNIQSNMHARPLPVRSNTVPYRDRNAMFTQNVLQPPQRPAMPPASQPPNVALNMPTRSTPAPYQRTGDPEFAQASQFPNVSQPSVPPASKLPPPKLTRHSLALLNVFKGQGPKLEASNAKVEPENYRKEPLGDAKLQQQNALLGLLKKPISSPAPAPAPPAAPAPSSAGLAELAAAASPALQAPTTILPAEKASGWHGSANGGKRQRTQGPRTTAEAIGETSATVSGPLNLPYFEGLSKPQHKHRRPSPRQTAALRTPPPKQNIVILPRPNVAKESHPPSQPATKPMSPPPRNVKLSELTKPFQPKILRRPVKEDLEASLPTHTVTVSAFSQPSKDVPKGMSAAEEKPQFAFDRRPSQNSSQKQALLSLFGKKSIPPVEAPTEKSSEVPIPLKSPPMPTVISPISVGSPQIAPSAVPQVPASRIGSISPVATSESNRSKATSPVDKAFLLGYLEGVAKGKR